MIEKQSSVLSSEMMGLQTAIKEIKATTKRKYEIEADYEGNENKEVSPPKTPKFSGATNTTTTTLALNNKSNTLTTLKSIKSDIIPPETHHWSNEPIDSISKLQAVAETWSNGTLTPIPIPFNCTSNTLTSLAQTAENITRSTLATTLLDQDDLLDDDDEDDFQDDFDFDDEEDDDDLLLDDQTIINNQNYAPMRHHYIPAYPKTAPESYQNCSRTASSNTQYSNHVNQPHLRSPFFHGTNNGSSWSYYNHHHHQHYDLGSHPQQPSQQPPQQTQTIRCAENGKSYFELGSSNNYCSSNRFCNNGIGGMMKNCCEGRNNLWCTAKQCYKEKRLKMMNLSMFKLARFRQASDQSLYRSVLICNTLKSLEKEIEIENQIYHQRMQQHRQTLQQNQQQSIDFNSQSFHARLANSAADPKHQQQQAPPQHQHQQQQQQNSGSNNNNNNANSNESSIVVHCNLGTCNSFSQPYIPVTSASATNNCIISRIPSFNDAMPIYEHHPLKDSSSGRATPFPSTPATTSVVSQLVSSTSNSVNSPNDTDSAFGDAEDVDTSSTRSIDWGSVLSLSSQSALDPLSNNDIFTSTTSTSLTQTSTSPPQSSSMITNLHVTISNTSTSSSITNSTCSNTSSAALTSATSSSSSSPISSIITTLTTVSSCSLESLTASSISVSQSVSNTNWDFPYLETESSGNSDFYELNCYKLSSALNQMDDFVKSEQLTPLPIGSSVSQVSANELEQSHHQINIMVGS
jgi:hypothetical protein